MPNPRLVRFQKLIIATAVFPSWFLYGALDKNIPAAVIAFTADRAKAKKVVAIKNGSHAVMVSHPEAVVKLIDDATGVVCTSLSNMNWEHEPSIARLASLLDSRSRGYGEPKDAAVRDTG